MKQYFTKTGVALTVIQGQGLGDGIPRGVLMVADGQALEARTKDIAVELKSLWGLICDRLSLRQFELTMGGSLRFADKAKRAMQVSQSRAVHNFAKRIIELDVELSRIKAS